MIIDCISDLHGSKPDLQGGDLLVIAGDLTARNKISEYVEFFVWLRLQEYRKKIVIAGNHDGNIGSCTRRFNDDPAYEYLLDEVSEFEGLKIWGSPWTPKFYNWHFMKSRGSEIAKKWALIPQDVDILVTHGPPQFILDETDEGCNAGCEELWKLLYGEVIKPRLHIFGHIHEGYGQVEMLDIPGVKFVNCSIMNRNYEPVNKPIRVIL